ncbi:MAG: IreB family regulatory phosphoprotein [Tenericutes bacterium]|jgi:uncharacterized protein (UPF0297 family)|nr:IreB family regulatory phosphoprotein [Mycoplasmatota bacterium]
MSGNTTGLYTVEEFDDLLVHQTLDDVFQALEERGYNPINQMVGYLMSGDPGYISSYKGARNKIMRLDRNVIAEVLLKNYIATK